MTRHVLDHRAAPEESRTRHLIEAARQQGEEGSHPASQALLKRAAGKTGARRMQEYLRIDRGREA